MLVKLLTKVYTLINHLEALGNQLGLMHIVARVVITKLSIPIGPVELLCIARVIIYDSYTYYHSILSSS
jgi:hypothetical protein